MRYFIGCLCIPGVLWSADYTVARSLSPKGKFEVAFEAPGFNPYARTEAPKVDPTLHAIRYKVSFYRPGTNTAIATSEFYDVQVSTGSPKPTAVKALVEKLIWSPEEDFVILPPEPWPKTTAAPRGRVLEKAGRLVVSLDPSSSWQTGSFYFQEKPLLWMNKTQVAGNWKEDCRAIVGQFDARTGKTTPLMEAAPPEGYEIVAMKGNLLVMKKILSPCAKPADVKNFRPECTILNLTFNRKEIGSCPP